MTYTSWAWPNIFDVSRNKVNLYTNTKSLTNRIKLLLLTDPTELYNNPKFGVGLRKYLFRYNNDNVIALIRDELVEQLRLWEPGVVPEETKVVRGLQYTRDSSYAETVSEQMNTLNLTVTVTTRYMQQVSFGISESDITGKS